MVFPSLAFPGPPTPPREVDHDIEDALDYLDDSFETTRICSERRSNTARELRYTPPRSSSSPLVRQVNSNSSGKSKRVEFSPWTNYHKAPASLHGSAAGVPAVKPLPPSKTCRSMKSILKSTGPRSPLEATDHNPVRLGIGSAHKFESFADMLESAIHQLGGDALDLRLDAYIVLLGTLKAYEEAPNLKDLPYKITQLVHFIRRDMVTQTSPKPVEVNLASQALKLLAALMRIPSLSSRLDEGFCSFLLDRSILLLRNEGTPKSIFNHHLNLLAQQNFSSRVMTPERASKLIAGLSGLEARVKSNSAVGLRLAIYRQLLKQARQTMVAKFSDWIEHVFHGMLSSLNEIRSRAIDLGTAAAMTLGTISQCSKAVTDLLDSEAKDGMTYGAYLSQRLLDMLHNPDLAHNAPQIWIVPILFLRSRRRKLQTWTYLKQWLSVIQKCLNTIDVRTKFHANFAWNRFVFVVNLDEATPKRFISMLRQPVRVGLERKANDKNAKQVRHIALNTFYNLLYYSLRPGASIGQVDLYWDEYVHGVLEHLVPGSKKDANLACRILSILFGSSVTSTWNENRANELRTYNTDELPRIDPKWLRLRITKVMKTVRLCFTHASWSTGNREPKPLRIMWEALMKAIGEAASQEIKTSPQLKEAIAGIMNLLHDLWYSFKESDEDDATLKGKILDFNYLVQAALDRLGSMKFVEKIIIRNSKEDFMAALTPSHRAGTTNALMSPAMTIFGWLIQPPFALETASLPALANGINALLVSSLKSRMTRSGKLEMLKEFSQIISEAAGKDSNRATALKAWLLIAELTGSSLVPHSSELGSSENCVREYMDVIIIILSGLFFDNEAENIATARLFQQLMNVADSEGLRGLFMATPELITTLLQSEQKDRSENSIMFLITLLLEGLSHCGSVEKHETARDPRTGSAATSALPCPELTVLYQRINASLTVSYEAPDSCDASLIGRFLQNLGLYIRSVPNSRSVSLLRVVQAGASLWISDDHSKTVNGVESSNELEDAVLVLWSSIRSGILSLPYHDSTLLSDLESVISSSLLSRRKVIVDEMLSLWDSTFGKEKELQYPPKVEDALRKLDPSSKIRLPTFPSKAASVSTSRSRVSQSPKTSRSKKRQRITKVYSSPQASQSRVRKPFSSPSARSSAHQPSRKLAAPLSTPSTRNRLSPFESRQKPRLRHDESQIQFAAIESSPMGEQFADSQTLTDHQKEVRSRQQVEAAMFPDIRSSPKAGRPDTEPISRSPQPNPAPPVHNLAGLADAPTPTVDSPSFDFMHEFVHSSPTPHHTPGVRSSLNKETSVSPPPVKEAQPGAHSPDPPSSPPQVQQFESFDPVDRALSSNASAECVRQLTLVVNRHDSALFQGGELSRPEGEHLEKSEGSTGRADRLERLFGAGGERSEPSVHFDEGSSTSRRSNFLAKVDAISDQGILPNSDVFVDARTDQLCSGDEDTSEHFVDASPLPSNKQPRDDMPYSDLPAPGAIAPRLLQVEVGPPSMPAAPTQQGHSNLDLADSEDNPHVSPGATTSSAEPNLGNYKTAKDPFALIQDDDISLIMDLFPCSDNASLTERHGPPLPAPASGNVSLVELPQDHLAIASHGADVTLASPGSMDDSCEAKSSSDTRNESQVTRKRKSAGRMYRGSSKRQRTQISEPPPPRQSPEPAENQVVLDCIAVLTEPSQLSQSSQRKPLANKASNVRNRKTSITNRGKRVHTTSPVGSALPKSSLVEHHEDDSYKVKGKEEVVQELEKSETTPNRGKSDAFLSDHQGHSFHNDDEGRDERGRVLSHVEIPLSATNGAEALRRSTTVAPSEDALVVDEPVASTGIQENPADEAAPGSRKRARRDSLVGAESLAESASSRNLEVADSESMSTDPNTRPKIKPKSILGRLKQLLADCRQLVLGSQEERDIDDALFEVRKEVHEAGRRGRGL